MGKYDIVTIEQGFEEVLCNRAHDVPFPLSDEHKDLIIAMRSKFADETMAGLAAPQVGAPWRIIFFQVDEGAYKYRDNIEETVPLTILINPSYEPIEEEGTNHDWEACFSVEETAGKPERWNVIRYKGQSESGEPVEGIARGFLARLLQHEIDHVDGRLFLSRLKAGDETINRKEHMANRAKQVES